MLKRFTISDRQTIAQRIIAIAQEDPRITGGAVVGSSANSSDDRWSDLDLTFGVSDGHPLTEVLDDWTRIVHQEFGVVHSVDLPSGPSIYRMMLLRNALELDLSVSPQSEFRPRTNSFKLVFGSAAEAMTAQPPREAFVVGLIWHHIIHVRNAIARGKLWLAEFWLHTLRDQVTLLCCMHRGLPFSYAKGMDALDADLLRAFESTLTGSLDSSTMLIALRTLSQVYLSELPITEPELATQMAATIEVILSSDNAA